MTRLSLFSEPFAPTGNMAGEGFRRLLGRPALGLLQTVLRESLQNVVDAAVTDEGPKVLVRVRKLGGDQLRTLREAVLAEPLAAECSADPTKSLDAAVRILEIADFRTIGLSGPTRADHVHVGGEPPNFVNFFRNVGAGRDSHQGGGTYGYGKSSFYAVSQRATILADSLTHVDGVEERRFLGCHLGAAFDVAANGARKRYTGRHWWGIRDETDNIEPLRGDAAAELAHALGLPVRGAGNTGTTIMVLDPELPDVDSDGVAKEIIETILWNFWPRMTQDCPQHRRLAVNVEVEGCAWTVPTPESFPPLDLFARAMAQIRSKDAEVRVVHCERPKKMLGQLAVAKGVAAARDTISVRRVSLVPAQSCHIALMRPVELVVKYLKGTPFPDSRFEWAGVFLCSDADEVEAAFAQSEPPAHDDWVPDNLPKGYGKTFVNVALARLKEEAAMFAHGPGSGVGSTHSQEGLVDAAALLGAALAGGVAPGPGTRQPTGGGGSSPNGTTVGKAVFQRLLLGSSGERIARFTSVLKNGGGDSELSVVARAFVCVDGGGGDASASEEHPVRVLTMSLAQGERSSDGGRLQVGRQAGKIVIDVQAPNDAAVGVKLELVRGAR